MRQSLTQAAGFPGFIEFVAAHEGLLDFEMFQQLAGTSGVLGGYHVAFAQGSQSAQSDILEVANGRGNEVKRAGLEWRVSHAAAWHRAGQWAICFAIFRPGHNLTRMTNEPENDPPRKYVWPWYLLGFLGLGGAITFIWMLGMAWPQHERLFMQLGFVVLVVWLIGANIVMKRRFDEHRARRDADDKH